jgi:RNA polymerase sigma-70 factor (ECF subfamily)
MQASEVERLYQQFGHRVYLRCLYLLHEESQAMDMVQDTFAALLNRFFGFADDRSALSWLLKVATNRSLNELRRRRYWQTEPMEEEGLAAEGGDEVEGRLLLERVLAGFSGKKASIVTGYVLEGKTMDEVAQECGVSLPTVRRTLALFQERARRRAGRESREAQS